MSVETNASFSQSVPVGCAMDWFSDTPPDDWMLCQGQAISRTEYSELFTIIGTTYGVGDGLTTFNLPDFRGRVGVGKSASGIFNTLGAKKGEEKTVLKNENLPTYVKSISVTKINKADLTFNGTVVTNVTSSSGGTSRPTGIDIVQPSLVMNKIIKVR